MHLAAVWWSPFSPSFYLPIDAHRYHVWAIDWLNGSWPPHIPFERTHGKKRLTVVSAEPQPPQILLAVEDPNDHGRRSTFVLVKEDGDLRLDLVATAAYNYEQVPAASPGPTFVPQALSPDEIARIRSQQPESFR